MGNARWGDLPDHHVLPAHRARLKSVQANGLGWYPEFNKVWEWFGMPGYSF